MIAAAVVTYNRRALLRECLLALREQTVSPDRVIVVDNASTDGTSELLATEFPEFEHLRLTRNRGASGGFSAGMAAAIDCEWVWVLDDDTVARPDALERLLAALDRLPAGPPPAMLLSRVDWSDGHAHPMNMPIVAREDVPALVAAVRARLLPVRAGTWVSALMRGEALARHGLPERAYFMQADDIEHTARILRHERGFLVPDSVVEHRTPRPHSALSGADPDKVYFAIRNSLHMARGGAFALRERPFIVAWVARTAVGYIRQQRSLRALATVLRAVRDGIRPLDEP